MAAMKDIAQHHEEHQLEFAEKTEWNPKGPKNNAGKKMKLIDRKRPFALKVKTMYNKNDEQSFSKDWKQSVTKGGL